MKRRRRKSDYDQRHFKINVWDGTANQKRDVTINLSQIKADYSRIWESGWEWVENKRCNNKKQINAANPYKTDIISKGLWLSGAYHAHVLQKLLK